MKRFVSLVALLLMGCSLPNNPAQLINRPTPTQPTRTPTMPTSTPMAPSRTPTAPSSTPTPHPASESLPVVAAPMLGVEDVAREMRLPFSSETTNLRLDLVQSDSCFVDCAGMSFTSENGFYDVMIYLFALAYETEAADLRLFMHNEAVASNAEGIPLPDGAYLEGLPEDASVFFLDRTWLVFARHNRVVIAIEVHLHV
ncbi:MAG: hypothetical protein PVF49_03715, partial [Anaerolineales bacterium]